MPEGPSRYQAIWYCRLDRSATTVVASDGAAVRVGGQGYALDMTWAPSSDEEIIEDHLLRSYDAKVSEFDAVSKGVAAMLSSRLKAVDINVHSVTARVKDRESYRRKLQRDPRRRIEDLVGIRVITYFREDIRSVEDVVRGVLDVDDGTYVNKAGLLAPGAFGYRSLQFVGRVPPLPTAGDNPPFLSSTSNIQWMGAASGTVEVQIRSILEHAWAEVDHDFVYKAESSIAPSVRRRFALTAALLEMADENLDTIRHEISQAPDSPDNTSEQNDLPTGYIQRLIETDPMSLSLDRQILAALDLPKPKWRPEKVEREISFAIALTNWHSGAQLRLAVAENADLAKRMAIVCTDVRQSILISDFYPYSARPAVAFPGIGIYWLAIAIGSQTPATVVFEMNTISKVRLAEYAVVASYLIAHPNESALGIRDRYRKLAAPVGAKTHPAITLD